MPNNKDNSNADSHGGASGTGRDFEGQGQKPGTQSGQNAGTAGGYGKDTGLQGSGEEDIDTAGGREGQFSDSDRGSKGPWSPGSSNPTDA